MKKKADQVSSSVITPPTIAEYHNYVENWQSHFIIPVLQQGSPVFDISTFGQRAPVPRSGQFAVAYFWEGASREKLAVRLFLKQVDETDEMRYIAVRLVSRELPFMVNFEYVRHGLWTESPSSKAKVYPIVIMERAEGTLLDSFIEDRKESCDSLLSVADRFMDSIIQMRKSNVAHGDLQHGNILVDESLNIKFVDYDGFYAPVIQPLGSKEHGHPNYNHPRRTEKNYGPEMDRFSALVIYLSIIATAYDHRYWDKYHEDDALIFTRNDFENPDSSDVFQDLMSCRICTIRELSKMLSEWCKQDNPLGASDSDAWPFSRLFDEEIEVLREVNRSEQSSGVTHTDQTQPSVRSTAPIEAQQNAASESSDWLSIQSNAIDLDPMVRLPEGKSQSTGVFNSGSMHGQSMSSQTAGNQPIYEEPMPRTKKAFKGSILALVLLVLLCWPAAIIYYLRKRE
jgi:serine/threonine protein kinase